MTFGEILEYLGRDVLKADTSIELLQSAVKEAHSIIQRQHDWPCMKKHLVQSAAPTIGLPTNIRRVAEVNVINSDGRKVALILPSSQDLNREYAESHRPEMCWWVEEQKLVFSRCLVPDATHKIQVDFYQKLPGYTNPTDTDWFSVWAHDALAYKAAEIASFSIPDDNRMPLFYQLATARMNDAWNMACESDSGGTSGIYRPPLRIPRENYGGFRRGGVHQ